MKARCCVWTGVLLTVFMVYTHNVSAALWEDTSAWNRGQVDVDFGGNSVPDGHIDYAVYAPGIYQGSYKDEFSDFWVYAYQVFNDNPNVGIDSFWVGKPAGAPASNPIFDPAAPYAVSGGIWTDIHTVRPESVIYIFHDTIGEDQHSQTLLFTSTYHPEMAQGGVTGGVMGGAIVELPSPVPEPATFSLIGAGALLMLRRRRIGGNNKAVNLGLKRKQEEAATQ